MLLLIEQGNTNTLFAVHDQGEWKAQWRQATDPKKTGDEYAVWLFQLFLMEGLKFEQITDCIISSVVPQSLFNLRKLTQQYFGLKAYIVGENATLGLEVRIDKPSEAGADRLVNAIGAHLEYQGDLIVIDSGTATTFDIVASDGAYEGGIIAPGIHLSMQALHQAAAKLPRVAIEKPKSIIGRDTVTAMQSGIYWGYMGLIDYLIDAIKVEFGRPMKVIATGGIASLFEGATTKIDHFDPDLTLKGLIEVYKRSLEAAKHQSNTSSTD